MTPNIDRLSRPHPGRALPPWERGRPGRMRRPARPVPATRGGGRNSQGGGALLALGVLLTACHGSHEETSPAVPAGPPVIQEKEPNNDPKAAQAIPAQAAVHARLAP